MCGCYSLDRILRLVLLLLICQVRSVISSKSFLHEFDSAPFSSSSLFQHDDVQFSSDVNNNSQDEIITRKNHHHRLFDEFFGSKLLSSFSSPSGGKDLFIEYDNSNLVANPSTSQNTLALELSHATQKNLLKTGTTIVGMCCRQGVVLAADTRSTGGPLVMDKAKLKIHQVSRLIYCCAAGTSADCDQLTREARHALQLLRLETAPPTNRVAAGGESLNPSIIMSNTEYFDPISAALLCISRSQSKKRGRSGDTKSSVLIMGGYDSTGPSLHSIDADGVFTRVSFSALGSGSTDAIAVLEDFLHHHHHHETSTPTVSQETSSEDDEEGPRQSACCANVSIEEAISVVRRAVTAGITNDLGSGSFIDFCVIEPSVVRKWREDGPCCSPLPVFNNNLGSATTSISTATTDKESTSRGDNHNQIMTPKQLLHEASSSDNNINTSSCLKLKLDAFFI
jgi:20S proteasome subunit beta 2